MSKLKQIDAWSTDGTVNVIKSKQDMDEFVKLCNDDVLHENVLTEYSRGVLDTIRLIKSLK